MGYRDVGDQREKEEQQWEERHEEVERHTCGPVDSTAFGEQFGEIAEHVEQRELSAWEMHLLQEIVVLMVPSPQRFVFSLDPHKP